MEKITFEEYNLTHQAKNISPEEFENLAQRALDLTEELCFGRIGNKEKDARRAMKEMISHWVRQEERKDLSAEELRVGNFSFKRKNGTDRTLYGISVSPEALLILERAGLRHCGV